MSDYTPTTNEVRSWATYVPDGTIGMHLSERDGAAFDRWLTQHDAEMARNALNQAADEMPARELAISEPVRMRVQEWLRRLGKGTW